MIGVLLISHGSFGESLIQNVCHVLGHRPPLLAQVGVAPQDCPEKLYAKAAHALAEVDSGQGVLVMSDMLGATPSNLAAQLLRPGHIEGLAGLNLPMLLRALTYRDESLGVMMNKASSGGRDGVVKIPAAPPDLVA